ncbi:hypothetical protein BaRGS_00016965 [Batillaria attramentaria]|uniref:Peptidase M14 carboxypeptidase A domain-containing protein n=1 Tax=Batillaria attramentaria TaxID=370345 RepID=A0ABD0KY10_9CAEN
MACMAAGGHTESCFQVHQAWIITSFCRALFIVPDVNPHGSYAVKTRMGIHDHAYNIDWWHSCVDQVTRLGEFNTKQQSNLSPTTDD